MSNVQPAILAALTLVGASLGLTLSASATPETAQPTATEQTSARPEAPVLLVCNACLQASDIGIRMKKGKPAPLTPFSMRTEQNLYGFQVQAKDHRGRPIEAPFPAGFNDVRAFLEWKPEYDGAEFKPSNKLRAQLPVTLIMGGMDRVAQWGLGLRPVIVPVEPTATWDGLVRTGHVCLGSTFEVPTYYFLGPQKLPMAELPGDLGAQPTPDPNGPKVDSSQRAFPATPKQTVCSGELRPLKTFLTEWAVDQVRAARDEARAAYVKEVAQASIKAAVDDWLDANRKDIAARASMLNKQP